MENVRRRVLSLRGHSVGIDSFSLGTECARQAKVVERIGIPGVSASLLVQGLLHWAPRHLHWRGVGRPVCSKQSQNITTSMSLCSVPGSLTGWDSEVPCTLRRSSPGRPGRTADQGRQARSLGPRLHGRDRAIATRESGSRLPLPW